MSESKFQKKFDPECKKEIVCLVEKLGRSPVEVAKDIDVSAATVRRWIRECGTKGNLALRSRHFPKSKKCHNSRRFTHRSSTIQPDE